MNFLKEYGDVEGPLGIPMRDVHAKALSDLLAQLKVSPELVRVPHFGLDQKGATLELDDGERADISWISTEDLDRARDVVLAKGIRDDFFKLNPVVTLNHSYSASPVGKSLWRKLVREGDRRGLKAKTHYPERPADWPADEKWMPDLCYGMVKAGLLQGKSIGFVPTKTRLPTDAEIRKSPDLQLVRRIVEECYLVEYGVCPFPVNQYTLVEAVSKSMDVPSEVWELLGIDRKALEEEHVRIELDARNPHPLVVFTPLAEVEKQLQKAAQKIDPQKIAEKIVQEGYHRARGGV